MKRARLWLVPLGLGAALSGLTWKLNHPSPTRADAIFAQLVSGADEVEIATFGGRGKISLKGTQLAALRECFHFENTKGNPTQGYDAYYIFTWKKRGATLSVFDSDFEVKPASLWSKNTSPAFNYRLNVRSGRRLVAKVGEVYPSKFR